MIIQQRAGKYLKLCFLVVLAGSSFGQLLCNISKTSASVSSEFPNTRKLMKARGCRPIAFIVFECLESPMKHEARVFEMASQSAPNCKQKKTKEQKHVIFAFFCLISAQFVMIMSAFFTTEACLFQVATICIQRRPASSETWTG